MEDGERAAAAISARLPDGATAMAVSKSKVKIVGNAQDRCVCPWVKQGILLGDTVRGYC